MKKHFIISIIYACIFCSCQQKDESANTSTEPKLFTRLKTETTGIDFINELEESEDFDVFRYRNYYNGAGVAIGDVNNDGLSDIYVTSNAKENKLFLNQGNLNFKDITKTAGVAGTRQWSTGVSMVDINGDGLLDVYVCNSGDIKGDDKENELFINNGNLTFTERAKEFGLADQGFSTHAVFFDFDKDGDLDCYLLNNSFRPVSTLGYRNIRNERDKLGGHKLFRNDNGFFNDVSEKTGIYGSVIGFGLGVTVGDVNHDNWPDIYVSNDFFERDYLYINNKNGTFTERLEESIGHTSMFSMGADLADLNNDGYLDIFSTDMLPEDDFRLKTITSFESYDVYQMKLKNGYYHQYMRNMLQLNNQDGTFSEIGQLAGVSATDWSWGALMADFNNDGYKEIFVSNGIYRDVTDQDFLEYMGNEENVRAVLEGRKIDYQKVIKKMPSNKLNNYLFTKDGTLHYKNVAKAWGIDEPSFSNGAAYGDLDNDGDLDLIINNVNQELFVYRNESPAKNKNHHLTLTFKGVDKNVFGLGTKVEIFKGKEIITYENMPIRGYESSMDYKMVIGVGELLEIDSMAVTWPDERVEFLTKIKTDQAILLDQKNAKSFKVKEQTITPLLEAVDIEINYTHKENEYNDFNNQRLLYQMLSTEGPAFAVADLNNDKLDDFFIGGASGQSGSIFIQQTNGKFNKVNTTVFDADSLAEDVDAIFFDADNDLDLDLYVVSGGSEFPLASPNLQDRLYINEGIKNGNPVFSKSLNSLPDIRENGSCVKTNDYDHDGDKDLFVGTRAVAGKYGVPCNQFILQNDGHGHFADVSKNSPDLKGLGMVTDAQWFNYNKDSFTDLIIVGDWMPITILENTGKSFRKVSIPSLASTEGWWNVIEPADIDNDGDMDFLAGNLGLNSKFKPTPSNPVSLYVNDFDQNNSVEQVYTYRKGDLDYPFTLKQELGRQLNFLNKKYIYNRDFAGKPVDEIFEEDDLKRASIYSVKEAHTSMLINNGNGFDIKPLPLETQYTPVYAILPTDLNHDGNEDIVLGGNFFAVKTEIGRYDAMHGLVLMGDGKGNFTSLKSAASGLKIEGEIKRISIIRGKEQNYIGFARTNNTIGFLKFKKR